MYLTVGWIQNTLVHNLATVLGSRCAANSLLVPSPVSILSPLPFMAEKAQNSITTGDQTLVKSLHIATSFLTLLALVGNIVAFNPFRGLIFFLPERRQHSCIFTRPVNFKLPRHHAWTVEESD